MFNLLYMFFFFCTGELCLIMEYCRYGNLRQFLKLRRSIVPSKPAPVEQLTLFDLTSFCLQVAKGMDFLASKKVTKK